MALRDRWYQNAIVYCLDVETFADSNGDGVGDFAGLAGSLDYLAGLGVNCLWLMPFYPSGGADDGYDVVDYASIDPRYGSFADFDDFMVEARERGMRVIVDLVANHTSVQHPWFQSARSSPDSPYRDYYVWRTDPPGDTSDEVVFPGKQQGIWTWDEEAQAYYMHRFYASQPDLNHANPAVRHEFRRIIGLWLQQGAAGFRIDAAPFLAAEGVPGAHAIDAHDVLREFEQFASVRSGNSILLGEVDVGLSTIADYFGGGNELKAVFNFTLNRYMFLALAQQSADPIEYGLQQLPTIPGDGHWLNFLRHHDELNLDRLTGDQREQVMEAFGPEPRMQAYGRGIRRRLAPMLNGGTARLRAAYSTLFSLPGAPMIFYGEEIGMGECLALPERLAVRTPMQWSPAENAGFSAARRADLVRPIVDAGPFSYEKVNVRNQRGNPNSLLNWLAALIRARRECRAIGTGRWRVLRGLPESVLGLRYDEDGESVVTLTNLGPRPVNVMLELEGFDVEAATEIFGDRQYAPLKGEKSRFRLNGYGARWLRVGGSY